MVKGSCTLGWSPDFDLDLDLDLVRRGVALEGAVADLRAFLRFCAHTGASSIVASSSARVTGADAAVVLVSLEAPVKAKAKAFVSAFPGWPVAE